MSSVTVDVRRAPELDLEAYAAFQKEAFRDLLVKRRASDRHMTAQFYRWKYCTPDGAARIATVRLDGEIVSSCAALPLRVSFGRALVTAWHFVDVATLPVERGRGRFSSALRALAESIPTGDVSFAFPNQASIGGFRRLGFDENVVMTTWINLWPRLVRRPTGCVRDIDRFSSERDIAGMIDSGNRPCIDRRSDYLDWRYADHPINRYSLSIHDDGRSRGFSVTRNARVMDRDVVLVMELFGSTPGAQASLVAQAAERARSAGVGALVLMGTWVSLMTACRSWLAPVPSVLLPKRQVLVVRAGEHGPTSVVCDRWILRTGDWDVF